MAATSPAGSNLLVLGRPSPERIARRQGLANVDRLFAGSPEEMVTALIEYRGLTKAEAERIRDMIETAEAKQPERKRSKK